MLITNGLDKVIVPVQCVVGNKTPTIVFDEEIDQMIDEELEYDTDNDAEERESYHIKTSDYQSDIDNESETSTQSWADEMEEYERSILQEEAKDPKYVLNILYDQDGIFLSIRKGEIMHGLWQTPGRKVDEGEIPMKAAIRETEEETGIIFKDKDLEYLFNDPEFNCNVYITKVPRDVELEQTEKDKNGPWIYFDFLN